MKQTLRIYSISKVTLGQEEGDIEDNLIEKCYCPGDEYSKLIPELMKTITRVAREKGKSAEIQRVHVPTKIGLPPIEVLGRMVEFSGYTRHQLLQISHEDLIAVAIQAQAENQAMLDLANLTRNARNQSYEELVAQNEDFVENMTLKKDLILEAQEEVRNPQQGEEVLRRRRSLTANDSNNPIENTTDSLDLDSSSPDNSTTPIDTENTTSTSSIITTTTTTESTTSTTSSTTTTTTTTAYDGVTEPWNEYDPPGMLKI